MQQQNEIDESEMVFIWCCYAELCASLSVVLTGWITLKIVLMMHSKMWSAWKLIRTYWDSFRVARLSLWEKNKQNKTTTKRAKDNKLNRKRKINRVITLRNNIHSCVNHRFTEETNNLNIANGSCSKFIHDSFLFSTLFQLFAMNGIAVDSVKPCMWLMNEWIQRKESKAKHFCMRRRATI